MRQPLIIQILVHQIPILRQHAVRVGVARVVVDAVDDVVREVEVAFAEGGEGGARGGGQAADGRVDDVGDVLAKSRDHGVQVDGGEGVVDHAHEVFKPGFQEDFGVDIFD